MTTTASNNNNNNVPVLSIVLGTTLVVGMISSLGWNYYYNYSAASPQDNNDDKNTTRDKSNMLSSNSLRRSTISNIDKHNSNNNNNSSDKSKSSLIKPPFPQTLRDMLSKCRLAYLSTVDTLATSSHLSLMRFTYLHDEQDGEIVIMSTNKNTKKFDMLRQQKGVALLVHDSSDQATTTAQEDDNDNNDNDNSNDNSNNKTLSVTLNGDCRILSGADEDKYRQAHLKHNPDYPQFIVGDDIAVLCVHVTSARICDLNDNVIHWNC